MHQNRAKRLVAEFIGRFAFILIGIGAIHPLGAASGGLLGIARAPKIGRLAGLIYGSLLIQESE